MTPPTLIDEAHSGPMGLVRLAVRFNLHPEHDFHSSWLPEDWPPGYRKAQEYGPAGQSLLGRYLRRWGSLDDAIEFNFDSRVRRLALLDGACLRRLAAYCGLCTHKPLFEMRSTAPSMRRLARRIEPGAAEFVLTRAPTLTDLILNNRIPRKYPAGAGWLVMNRGYRMLLGVLATEGPALLGRTLRKLPRRVSALPIPHFTPVHISQLGELIFLCLIPERMPQWDWLF